MFKFIEDLLHRKAKRQADSKKLKDVFERKVEAMVNARRKYAF